MKGLEIKDCLDDLKHYAGNNKSINLKRRQVDDLCVELIESLASIVEFDGLETTQDPSPRSSLTMTMYNDDKATFVTRMLSERVAPTITSIVKQYSAEAQATSQQYVLDYYVSEMPPNKRPVVVVASGEA
uniref:Uncharacterized protein n=1 Tax=Craspedostauros australis TaxID=1486917 RepID=A0A7R9WU15_9STRA